jgi:hypothetical protein
MSIKQEKVTELRVISIISKLTCDGCAAVMSTEEVKVGFYNPDEKYDPAFNLAPGWVEIVKGQYGNRTKHHACGKCLGSRVEELLSQ